MKALFALDWTNFSEAQLDFIKAQQKEYEELIFVISRPESLLEGPLPQLCSGLLTRLQLLFTQELHKPFYLLPIPGKGMPDMYHWARWRILCPSFRQVFTDNATTAAAMELVLRVPVTVIPASEAAIILPEAPEKKRGIFITRAQPFHEGHTAYLQQMQDEMEEVIIVIGVANQSHVLRDFATAGERLEMIKPFLQQTWPGRHHLVALPYSDFSLENFYELEYLLPAFHTVYTINTSTITYAHTAGYPVKNLAIQLPVSGTHIRDCMIHDRPYAQYVPPVIYEYLQRANLAERLKQLQEKENR